MNGFVEIIEGAKGSGKTLMAVERAYELLERGGWVFTNIKMLHEKIGERMASRGYKFEPERCVVLEGEQVMDFGKYVARGTAEDLVMVVIDEAALEGMDCRDFKTLPRELDAINALARKLDIWLSYICQDRNMLPISFRRQTDELWSCSNLKQLKIWGFLPCPIPLLFRSHYDMRKKHQKPMYLGADVLWRPSWAFGLYDSDALLGEFAQRIGAMRQVARSPLVRIPRVSNVIPKKINWPCIAASFACALFSTLS